MALALALVRCRCLLVGFDSPPLPLPFPVTPALLTTLLLPVRGGPITPRRTPTLPVHGPLPDKTDCNTEKADGTAGKAVHIPSAGRHATTCLRNVEQDCRIGHTQVGPRELSLPQVKPRRRALTRLRGLLIGTSPFRITTTAKGSQQRPGTRCGTAHRLAHEDGRPVLGRH